MHQSVDDERITVGFQENNQRSEYHYMMSIVILLHAPQPLGIASEDWHYLSGTGDVAVLVQATTCPSPNQTRPVVKLTTGLRQREDAQLFFLILQASGVVVGV
jgi:hypothetical protein